MKPFSFPDKTVLFYWCLDLNDDNKPSVTTVPSSAYNYVVTVFLMCVLHHLNIFTMKLEDRHKDSELFSGCTRPFSITRQAKEAWPHFTFPLSLRCCFCVRSWDGRHHLPSALWMLHIRPSALWNKSPHTSTRLLWRCNLLQQWLADLWTAPAADVVYTDLNFVNRNSVERHHSQTIWTASPN